MNYSKEIKKEKKLLMYCVHINCLLPQRCSIINIRLHGKFSMVLAYQAFIVLFSWNKNSHVKKERKLLTQM